MQTPLISKTTRGVFCGKQQQNLKKFPIVLHVPKTSPLNHVLLSFGNLLHQMRTTHSREESRVVCVSVVCDAPPTIYCTLRKKKTPRMKSNPTLSSGVGGAGGRGQTCSIRKHIRSPGLLPTINKHLSLYPSSVYVCSIYI